MNENKKNITLAFVLSALIAVVGAVVWGLLYYAGWFASIVSYATVFGMIFVYAKYHKINAITYVWVLALNIILNVLACFLAIIFAVMAEASCSFVVAVEAFGSAFSEIAGQFLGDILLSILFSVLGAVTVIILQKKRGFNFGRKQNKENQIFANAQIKPEEQKTEEIVSTQAESSETEQQPENNNNDKNNLEENGTQSHSETSENNN